MRAITPSWRDLQELVAVATNELWVCSPFVTDEGLGKIIDALATQPRVHLWTRLSPSDWAAGASDPEAIAAFLELVVGDGLSAEMCVMQRLHAKFYMADDRLALTGSSNLTAGGFVRNLELMVQLTDQAARDALELLQRSAAPHGRPVQLSELKSWIERWRPNIEDVRRTVERAPEELAPIQADLDRMLGFGAAPTDVVLPDPTAQDLEDFVEWLAVHPHLAGAHTIYRRHTNADGQNLMGHVRQSFAAACRFLTEREELRAVLSAALDRLNPDDIYAMEDNGVSEAWLTHFDGHATDAGADYDYSILRSYLPPSLGGTRLGGGGGSSTFKRVLPLAARYLLQ